MEDARHLFYFFLLAVRIAVTMAYLRIPLYSSYLLTAAFLLAAIACTFAANHGCRFIDVNVLGSALHFSRGIWKVRTTTTHVNKPVFFLSHRMTI
jgi:hypothetical protein